MQNINRYHKEVSKLLERVLNKQKSKFKKIANEFFSTYKKDGMIYIFGTGHSHMLAEEGHFRAGGFAPICSILNSSLILHEDTTFISVLERTEGVATKLINKYNITENDILVIFTNS